MRISVVVATGLGLATSLGVAGCSSMSSMDVFKTTPPQITLQLDSEPGGADATTSIGPGCKTPCSVSVPATENFTVTYTLNNYQPETIPVTVVAQPGEAPLLDPNPAVAELQPAAPVAKPKAKKRASHATRAPKPAATAPASAATSDSSPFPPPPR